MEKNGAKIFPTTFEKSFLSAEKVGPGMLVLHKKLTTTHLAFVMAI